MADDPTSLAELIKRYESNGGNYTSRDPRSTASGAYGFVNGTWQQRAGELGVDTKTYPTAAHAPPEVQDRVFEHTVSKNGLRDWTCPGCNPALSKYIADNPGAVAKMAQTTTAPSVDDLSKRIDALRAKAAPATAAAPGEEEAPSIDDLSKRIDALRPPQTEAPPQQEGPRVGQFDDYGRPISTDMPEVKAGASIAQSYRDAGSLHNWLAAAPDTEYSSTPLVPFARNTKTGDIRWALPGPVRDFLYSATGDLSEGMTVDPTTGRFGTTPEMGSAINMLAGAGARPLQFGSPIAATPLIEREAPLSPEFKANALAPEAKAAALAPPAGETSSTGIKGPPPAPVAEEPVRLSPEDQRWVAGTQQHVNEILAANKAAGVPGDLSAAATPAELAKLTPGQTKAYRRQAELGDILAPPEPGVDRNIYVEGSEPTKAEWSGDPVEAQKERLLRQRDPASYDARLKQNTDARVRSYENMEGTNIEVDDLRRAKDAAAERDGGVFLKVAKPLDLQPQLDWLNAKMTDPRVMENPDAMKVLGDLKASLFDANGQLKTDPRSGWGMHDNMINRLDKANDRTSAERYAKSLLTEYKQVVDGVNNVASNGAFQKFLDNQSSYAQQINAKTLLQDFRPRLTNTKGDINISAFHKFVVDLAKRRGNRGVDPAMDIPDETMRGLINIDKDLKRSTNIDLGKARGSETNLFYALAQGMGLGAAHLGMAAMTAGSPAANIVLQGGLNLAGKLTGNVLLRRNVRRGLSPPPEGYSYNPLQGP